MQNKPNFRKSQMNVSIYLQTAYENKRDWTLGQNKPNSNPIKPNLRKAKMDVNIYYTKVYENISDWTLGENKPNSNPIQTQSKPISERMNVNFCATGYYESKSTFAVRKARPNSQNVEFNTAFSDGARFITPKSDKIALKIYPFGIDYPIVLKEILRKMSKNVILSGASAQRRISFCA